MLSVPGFRPTDPMHELSIADSILDSARRHVPAGGVLCSVTVRVGPMRGIDQYAMECAWRAVTDATDAEDAQLVLDFLPWRLRCSLCGRVYSAGAVDAPCQCGSSFSHPLGGDELILDSLVVDEEPAAARSAI